MTERSFSGAVPGAGARRSLLRFFRLAGCGAAAVLLVPLLETPLPRHESEVPEIIGAVDEPVAPPNPLSRLGVTLKRGDTLLTLLTRHGLSRASAHELIAKVRPLVNLRKLKTGDQVDLVVHDADRSVQAMEVKLEDIIVHAKATADGWDVERRAIPSELATRVIRGTIKSSLYDNGIEAGLSAEHILELSKIFEYDIDFFPIFAVTINSPSLSRSGTMPTGGACRSGSLPRSWKPTASPTKLFTSHRKTATPPTTTPTAKNCAARFCARR